MIRSLAVLSMLGVITAAGAGSAATPPIILSVANAAASVWDTDPFKAGVELQIINSGSATAADVRVTSVDVRGGSLAAATALPIALGTIAPRGSALLDLVITVPRTDATEYRLTISGTYRHAGRAQRFSFTRAVTPSSAPPGPIKARSGISATTPSQPASPAGPPAAGGPPGFEPNATTPMLIPPGPPRGPSLPNPGEADPATRRR